MRLFCWFAGVGVSLLATHFSSASAATYTLRSEDALFAVVTNKAGVASKFAHHHLIAAKKFDASIEFDPQSPEKNRFVFKTAVKDLVVDSEPLKETWQSTLLNLGVLPSPFTPTSPSDQEKITQNMLDEGQLNAARFPAVSAEVTALSNTPVTFGKVEFPGEATLSVTVRDKTIKRKIPARIKATGNSLSVEAVGKFAFTEFGIKPFSALLGAVRNQDEFFIYVNFNAEKP